MSRARLTRLGLLWLGLAAALTCAAVVAARLGGARGLRLTAVPARPGAPPAVRRVDGVDLRDLRLDAEIARARRATWDGYWRVPVDGRYKLIALGGGPIAVTVDGQPVVTGQSEQRLRGRVDLAAGLHALSVDYQPPIGPDQLRLRWALGDQPLQEFASGALFAEPPSPAEQAWARAARPLALLARLAWTLPFFVLVALALRGRASERVRRALRIALPALVVLYAAALRFDALVGRYAWEGSPWAIQAQRLIEGWRPGGAHWAPEFEISGGDPYHYVHRARTMRGFYEADAREPLFPALTGVLLRILDDRLLAVHAASAVCSTLLVLATYLLGAAAFSRTVGLAASLAMAIDRDALWWSVEGFRDDAFALFVVLGAVALVRLRLRPTTLSGVLAGLAGAAACLTRITSLSFLLPAFVLLLLPRDERAGERRRAVGVALLLLLALVGPFLLSCAIAYGDPFYAVNFHTKFYRSRSGQAFQESMSWLDYLRTGSALREQLATGFTGLTTYPFTNKWRGLEYVSPWLARSLSAVAVVGLALFLRSAQGRLLLVVLLTSLLPYAFTWAIPGGAEWRFTMHAYPFYLIAAALALTEAARWVRGRVAQRREAPSAAG
jgi:hypothetical protein